MKTSTILITIAMTTMITTAAKATTFFQHISAGQFAQSCIRNGGHVSGSGGYGSYPRPGNQPRVFPIGGIINCRISNGHTIFCTLVRFNVLECYRDFNRPPRIPRVDTEPPHIIQRGLNNGNGSGATATTNPPIIVSRPIGGGCPGNVC